MPSSSSLSLLLCCCLLAAPGGAQETGGSAAGESTPPPSAAAPEPPPPPPPAPAKPWRKPGRAEFVSIGRDSVLAPGEQADSVVAILGSAISEGEVTDSVVAVLGDLRVSGSVHREAVAVLGNARIDGKVDGDVSAVLGNVDLGPDAEVGGNIIVVGGRLNRDPKAIVHGGVGGLFGGIGGGLAWARPWLKECLLYARPLAFAPGLGWAWELAFGFLALYVLIGVAFRGAVERCVHVFETHPGRSALAALVALLLTPVSFVLLAVTVIGVLALPWLVASLFVASNFGRIVMLAWIGRRCTPFLAATPTAQMAASIVVGGVICLALYTVPVIGLLTYKLLGFLGLGIVIYTLVEAMSASRAARAAAFRAPPAAAPPPGIDAPPPAAAPATNDAPLPAAAPATSDAPPPPIGEPHAPTVPELALPRAGFWLRMAALLLDALLIGIVLGWIHHRARLDLVALAIYGAVMWKLRGTTIGGIICGLRVVRTDGRPIDWSTAIVRALSCFLSFAAAGLGFIWIAVDAERRAWHDKIAGTLVVLAPKGQPLV